MASPKIQGLVATAAGALAVSFICLQALYYLQPALMPAALPLLPAALSGAVMLWLLSLSPRTS